MTTLSYEGDALMQTDSSLSLPVVSVQNEWRWGRGWNHSPMPVHPAGAAAAPPRSCLCFGPPPGLREEHTSSFVLWDIP